MRQICVKGMKISNFLIKAEKKTYPMDNTKYLEMLPLYKESYITLQKQTNGQYKLMRFIFVK